MPSVHERLAQLRGDFQLAMGLDKPPSLPDMQAAMGLTAVAGTASGVVEQARRGPGAAGDGTVSHDRHVSGVVGRLLELHDDCAEHKEAGGSEMR